MSNVLKRVLNLDADSAFTKARERAEGEIRAELEAERERLIRDRDADVEGAEERVREAAQEEEAYRTTGPDRITYSTSEPDRKAIELSRKSNEARDLLTRLHNAREAARSRLGEIDRVLGADGQLQATVEAWQLAVDGLTGAIARRGKVCASISTLKEGVEVAQRQLDQARDTDIERLGAAIERGELDTAACPKLTDLERVLSGKRALYARATGMLSGLANAITAKREELNEIRNRYVAAVIAKAELRWLAVQRLIGGEVLEIIGAKRLGSGYRAAPELPRVDELAAERRSRELLEALSALPQIPDLSAPVGVTDDAPNGTAPAGAVAG